MQRGLAKISFCWISLTLGEVDDFKVGLDPGQRAHRTVYADIIAAKKPFPL